MKKILLFSYIFILAAGTAHSQDVSIDWFKLYKGTGRWIDRDAQNNVYTVASDGIILLNKRDKFGNLLWERSFTTDTIFNYETPSRVHVDSQNNVIVVGFRYTFSQENGARANALIVLKYSPQGALLWQKIITGYFSAFYQERYHNSVTSVLDASNNIYVASGGAVGNSPQGFNTVKISPAGSIVWVRTESFNGSTFYLVYNIRLKNQLIGLAGFHRLSGPTALIWLLDTAGVTRWAKINEGLYGRDIAFDNNNNVYLLCSILNGAGANTASDVSVYKFTVGGGQLWVRSYDFGGYEGVQQIEFSFPDKNLVIIANGNQFLSGGSLYVDWLTIKIDNAGTVLWSQRYDKHNNNDEDAVRMAVNKRGDIYVTGIGGPFPGGSNLGKRQWITTKYLANGKLDWFVPIDTLTEYITGVSIALASDGTIFVLADASSALMRLLDFRGTGGCEMPTGVTAGSITNDKAVISWNAIANAGLYHLQYKTSTSQTWITISTDKTTYTLSSLFPGTTYDYRVEAVCKSGLSGYTAVKQFTTLGSGYCLSGGINSSNDFIDLVYVSNLLNSTGNDGGYEDYTYLSAGLQAGVYYDLTLSAEIINGPQTEAWKVWIDYNQDGDFNDAGEELFRYQSQQIGWETHTFLVPANAPLGLTRMRVSMKRGSYAGACDTFPYGEVEDYTINIFSQANSISSKLNNGLGQAVKIFPNPVSNNLTITFNAPVSSSYEFVVSDIKGKNLLSKAIKANSGNNQLQIDVSALASGVYFLRLQNNNNPISIQKFLKQ
jgi:hypothetical protein